MREASTRRLANHGELQGLGRVDWPCSELQGASAYDETTNHQNYNRRLSSELSAQDYVRLDWTAYHAAMHEGGFTCTGKHPRAAIARCILHRFP